MKVISEKEMLKLSIKGKALTQKKEKITPVMLKNSSKNSSIEERQVKAIERISQVAILSIESANKQASVVNNNIVVLSKLIDKIEPSEPWEEIEAIPIRDNNNIIMKIVIKKMR